MTVISIETWEPVAGRAADLDAMVSALRCVHERLGTRISLWRPLDGPHSPDCIVYFAEFDSLSSYRETSERCDRDAEYQRVLRRVGPHADTPAIAVRIGGVVLVEIG